MNEKGERALGKICIAIDTFYLAAKENTSHLGKGKEILKRRIEEIFEEEGL